MGQDTKEIFHIQLFYVHTKTALIKAVKNAPVDKVARANRNSKDTFIAVKKVTQCKAITNTCKPIQNQCFGATWAVFFKKENINWVLDGNYPSITKPE